MNRIRHIAIFTPDPEKTANFYKDVFGLEVAGPAGTGRVLPERRGNQPSGAASAGAGWRAA